MKKCDCRVTPMLGNALHQQWCATKPKDYAKKKCMIIECDNYVPEGFPVRDYCVNHLIK